TSSAPAPPKPPSATAPTTASGSRGSTGTEAGPPGAMIAGPADLPAAFQAAWNAHDMAAFGALFHGDATFVNRFATYTRGVEKIVALHRGIHETIYRDSILENELIDVGQIADGAAIVHFWSRLTTGASHPAGPHQIDTL